MNAREVGLILIQTGYDYKIRIEGVLNYPFQHTEIVDVDINSETKVVTLKVKK